MAVWGVCRCCVKHMECAGVIKGWRAVWVLAMYRAEGYVGCTVSRGEGIFTFWWSGDLTVKGTVGKY